jgi:hypothetical protein
MNELIADELSKLARLRDEGVLTEDEFAARKTLLLSRKPGSAAPSGLRAFFGCLGLIALVVLMPQIGAIFRDECIQKLPPSLNEPALDAKAVAADAAKAASKAADELD